MPLGSEQLEAIVAARTFDTLLGEIEGPEFECKAQPYQTSSEAGKRELAKDVSALANANGGIIFIGLKTKQSDTHFGDEVEAVRPFLQTLVNPLQYGDILRAWIYPEIAGVAIQWIPTTPDPSKGLIIIRVPNQAQRTKPFLITKTIDGAKHVETVFGYAVRKNDQNPPVNVEDLQRYLRSGLHYDQQLEERLDAIAILLKSGQEHSGREVAKQVRLEQIEQRIQEALQTLQADMRLLIISAQPLELSNLQTIFLNDDAAIKRKLERPPVLRSSGWDLSTLDQARIVRGELIRVTDGHRKVIDLYRDGAMVAAVSADRDFLAWGRGSSMKINPIALCEFVYAFTNLYGFVLSDFIRRPGQISFRIDLKKMHLGGAKSVLAPHALNSFAQMSGMEDKHAPDNDWTIAISVASASFDAAIVAYDLIREIYLWFGLEEDKIPYRKRLAGFVALDIAALLKDAGG